MPSSPPVHPPQDGTISYEIKLTGELSTNQVSPGEDINAPEWGTLVAPGVNAQFHQHMFCARIDPAVDDDQGGKDLVVSEVRARIVHGGWRAAWGVLPAARPNRARAPPSPARVRTPPPPPTPTPLQVEAVALPEGPANPYGNAFTVKETDLKTEVEAQRVCDAGKGRYWKIKNPNSLHPVTGEGASTAVLACPERRGAGWRVA